MRSDHPRVWFLLLSSAVVALGTRIATAQWSVVNLHPPQATGESKASATSAGQHVGAAVVDGLGRAALWAGEPVVWNNLNPPGFRDSYVTGVDSGEQVGIAFAGASHGVAVLWRGSTSSWVHLGPPNSEGSSAHGVRAGRQIGQARFGDRAQAGMWSGSSATWVKLHSDNFEDSVGFGISLNQQVGIARLSAVGGYHAILWNGSSTSWVDLHPNGASESNAFGVDIGIQVGHAWISGTSHAGLWRGTSSSWVDLHPPNAGYSSAAAVHAGQIAGYAEFEGRFRAGIWSDTASSWEDLSAYLEGPWGHSRALGISNDSSTTYVVGYGLNLNTNRNEALLWTSPCVPKLHTQPVSPSPCQHAPVSLSIRATGPKPMAFQWQWRRAGDGNWSSVVDGINVESATSQPIFVADGADTATVNLAALPSYLGGFREFRVVVTNQCGSTASSSARWDHCIADFNCSNVLSVQDIFDFLATYFAGEFDADFNGSMSLSVQDIFDFLAAYFAGCP